MPIDSPNFAPAIALVLWSLFMLAWLAVTRLPAMANAGIPLGRIVGSRGVNLEGVVPDRVNWKSHNYTHLMEQPTIFYATVVILGVAGAEASRTRRIGAAASQSGLDRAQHAASHPAEQQRVTMQEEPQPPGKGRHPLTYRHLREHVLDEVRGGLGPLRRVVQDRHRPRPLQEKATRKS